MRLRPSIFARLATSALCIVSGAALADYKLCPEGATVSESALATVRGGFDLPAGLQASLTLTRAAYVNGERVADLHVDIPDIAKITGAQADSLERATSALIIQSGPNNGIALSEIGLGSTVIQNTLSDVHLATLTTIGVQVNSLSAFRELNFQQGLSQTLGIVGGVR